MEGTPEAPRGPALGRAATSFRLRSPSLNTLRLRRVFDLFDHDGDGEITVLELRRALARLGLDADAADLEAAVAAHVRPGRAGLRFEDFEGLHRALGGVLLGGLAEGAAAAAEEEESDLAEAFKVFDENGDGFISAVELQAVLKKLGLPEGGSMARVREMICSVDRNDDGRVDFGEFKNMMQGGSIWGC